LQTLLEKIQNTPRIDYINYLILLYAFTLSFPSEIKRVIAIAMIILWLTDRTKYDFKLPKTNIFLFSLIFIGYSLVSYFWSDTTIKEAFDYIKRYWYYLPIFIIFKYLKKEFFEYAISSFFLGMLISEILSYGNFFNLWKIGLSVDGNPTVFIHHTTYSIFLAITSIFLLFQIITSNCRTKKIIYSIFFITVTINLFVNAGRTGYFTFFILITLLIFYKYKLNIKMILLNFFLLFVLVTLIYQTSTNFNNRIHMIKSDVSKVLESEDYNTSIGARIGFWVIAKEIFLENPLFGSGIADNIKQKNHIIETEKNENFSYLKELEHFHNSYLEILTQFGIIGLFMFLSIIYYLFKIKINDISINLLKNSTIIVFLLGSFTDNLFYLNASMTFFSFVIGLALAKYKFEN
jgi:O-antigen ligase